VCRTQLRKSANGLHASALTITDECAPGMPLPLDANAAQVAHWTAQHKPVCAALQEAAALSHTGEDGEVATDGAGSPS
jgi:hypothetical protein